MAYIGFEELLEQKLQRLKRQIEMGPIILGGVAASGGGVDGRPGGYLGRLSQLRVTYDKSEVATSGTVGSPTLVDNLNHIRYRVQVLENGTVAIIKNDGSVVASGVTIMDFGSEFGVTESPAGEANISIDDIYLRNDGDIGEGAYTFEGKVSLEENLKFVTNGALINFNDNVNIAHQSNDAILYAQPTLTSTYKHGMYIDAIAGTGTPMYGFRSKVTKAIAESQAAYGGLLQANLSAGSGTQNWVVGGVFISTLSGAATVTNLMGLYVLPQNLSTGIITTTIGINISGPINSGGGTIETYIGMNINTSSGIATTEYGLYIYNMGDYAIYTQGGTVRFGDDVVQIGGTNIAYWQTMATRTMTGNSFGFYYSIIRSDSGGNAYYHYGGRATTIISDSGYDLTAWNVGLYGDIYNANSGDVTLASGGFFQLIHAGSGVITQGHGIRIDIQEISSGTITTTRGVFIEAITTTGTSLYGLQIGNLAGATNNYAIHTGTGLVRFGDDVLIYGDTWWVDEGGLLIGEIWAHAIADVVTSVAQNDWDQIVAFDTNGEYNGTTPDHTNDHITILTEGKYYISFSWSGYGPATAYDWEFHICKNDNGTCFDNITAHYTTPTTQKIGSISCSGFADLIVDDTIELWVLRTSAGANIDLTTVHCTISLTLVAGT